MDTMWAPWRSQYLNSERPADQNAKIQCVFCDALNCAIDKDRYVVHRGKKIFVILNLYPYNNGHLLIIPNRHVCRPDMLDESERNELMEMVVKGQSVLEAVYKPHGINIGANIGSAAGAGIAQHMHFHVLPRWTADANFMTTIANVRVIPESLDETWEKIRSAW